MSFKFLSHDQPGDLDHSDDIIARRVNGVRWPPRQSLNLAAASKPNSNGKTHAGCTVAAGLWPDRLHSHQGLQRGLPRVPHHSQPGQWR